MSIKGNTLILEKCQTLDELYIDLYNNQSGSVKHEIILCIYHYLFKIIHITLNNINDLKLVVLGQSGVGDRLKLALVTLDCCTSLVAGANNERAYAQLQSLMHKLDAHFFTDGPDIWTYILGSIDNYINALIDALTRRIVQDNYVNKYIYAIYNLYTKEILGAQIYHFVTNDYSFEWK
ncbi:hypothetical protein ACJX0J_012432 [Zea mays]